MPLSALSLPDFLYGTAWKEDRTRALTELALRTGFRAIDTANQRRHYFEEGVGQALASAYDAGLITRDDLFLQTKFTYRQGQDHRLPYDPLASLTIQVGQSMASSLEHLRTDHVDSLCSTVHPLITIGQRMTSKPGKRCVGNAMTDVPGSWELATYHFGTLSG
jgi:aryl-alcohol dehydrogenase-like predicted oxidoreductase